ncbi:PTS sugar transporter subunit IIA, partial [Erysipelatoclostridium ramosum]|nr:PTS sugar transporter subunit IIA [Thomasclavelia ramosa]
MKITDLLKRESVELSRTHESKGQAIDQMVELMAKGGNINDLQRYKEGVLKREEE